jgi:hypothetical protein
MNGNVFLQFGVTEFTSSALVFLMLFLVVYSYARSHQEQKSLNLACCICHYFSDSFANPDLLFLFICRVLILSDLYHWSFLLAH